MRPDAGSVASAVGAGCWLHLHFIFRQLPLLFFFFQAEDGIRDGHVTGVQTCALPISRDLGRRVKGGVGDTGFEPVTSSVSGKRATAAPIALATQPRGARWRWVRDSNPCTRLCRPLPNHSANPPGDALASYGTALPTRCRERRSPGADVRIRTADPHLGKVMLFQLSYVRMTGMRGARRGRYWVRTSDLFRVKEARYHCANRPKMLATVSGGLAEAYMSLAQVAASRT